VVRKEGTRAEVDSLPSVREKVVDCTEVEVERAVGNSRLSLNLWVVFERLREIRDGQR
jgi:hypothetical protein